MAADDYKSVSRTQWSGVAGAWERHAKRFDAHSWEVASAWMLEAAGLRPGERVLTLLQHHQSLSNRDAMTGWSP